MTNPSISGAFFCLLVLMFGLEVQATTPDPVQAPALDITAQQGAINSAIDAKIAKHSESHARGEKLRKSLEDHQRLVVAKMPTSGHDDLVQKYNQLQQPNKLYGGNRSIVFKMNSNSKSKFEIVKRAENALRLAANEALNQAKTLDIEKGSTVEAADGTSVAQTGANVHIDVAAKEHGLALQSSGREKTNIEAYEKNISDRRAVLKELNSANYKAYIELRNANLSQYPAPSLDPMYKETEALNKNVATSLDEEEKKLKAVKGKFEEDEKMLADLKIRIDESRIKSTGDKADVDALAQVVRGDGASADGGVPSTASNQPGSSPQGATAPGVATPSESASASSPGPSFQDTKASKSKGSGFGLSATDIGLGVGAAALTFAATQAMKSNETPPQEEKKSTPAAAPAAAPPPAAGPAPASTGEDKKEETDCEEGWTMGSDGKCYENTATIKPDCVALREAAGMTDGSASPLVVGASLPQECR